MSLLHTKSKIRSIFFQTIMQSIFHSILPIEAIQYSSISEKIEKNSNNYLPNGDYCTVRNTDFEVSYILVHAFVDCKELFLYLIYIGP